MYKDSQQDTQYQTDISRSASSLRPETTRVLFHYSVVTDVLSDLIYKLFSQRCYIKNIGMGPSRGQFSQTVSLPFVKAQVYNIKHIPSVVCVIPQHGSSHDPFKEMESAPFCTHTDCCSYIVNAESWYLGLKYRRSASKRFKMENRSLRCYVLPPSPEIFW